MVLCFLLFAQHFCLQICVKDFAWLVRGRQLGSFRWKCVDVSFWSNYDWMRIRPSCWRGNCTTLSVWHGIYVSQGTNLIRNSRMGVLGVGFQFYEFFLAL